MKFYNNVQKYSFSTPFVASADNGYCSLKVGRYKVRFSFVKNGDGNIKLFGKVYGGKNYFSANTYMGVVKAGAYKVKVNGSEQDNKEYWAGHLRLGNTRWTVHIYTAEFTPSKGSLSGKSCRSARIMYKHWR